MIFNPAPRPEVVSRRHGKPMLCPNCEGDVYLDAPHICPEQTVRPAAAGTVLTFYGYNALNECCRRWVLLGWPQENGRPKLDKDERGRMHFECQKCHANLWFDIAHPDIEMSWDVRKLGKPQPPVVVGGHIT